MKSLLLIAALMMSPLAIANDHSCHVAKNECSKSMCAANDCDATCKKHCKEG
jgi:hypothetical protein